MNQNSLFITRAIHKESTSMRNIDVNQVVDEAKFTPFHLKVLFWCMLVIIFDGYDLVIYGVALKGLVAQWGLSAKEAGFLGSVALFGMMIGAMALGSLADRYGRKKMIALCLVLFSVFTFLCGFAQNPTQFALMRFVAGIGIGGAMPNLVAMMAEYSPKRMRSTMVSLMFSGYAIGGMLSAGLGILIVPTFGWEWMFYLGLVPLLLLPLILKFLPESLGFLMRHGHEAQVRQILPKLAPSLNLQADDQLVREELVVKKTAVPVGQLFQEKRGVSTLAFWASFFCCLLMVYALSTWLPKFMEQAGYELKAGLSFLFAMNIGAMVGAIGGGWLADKLNIKAVLLGFLLLGSVALVMLGYKTPLPVLYFLVAVAGATTIGTQIVLYSYVAMYYPLKIRSTGIGWASGIGRIGAIVGPILGGWLVALQLPHSTNFMIFAIPGVIAAVAVLFIANSRDSVAPAKTDKVGAV